MRVTMKLLESNPKMVLLVLRGSVPIVASLGRSLQHKDHGMFRSMKVLTCHVVAGAGQTTGSVVGHIVLAGGCKTQ